MPLTVFMFGGLVVERDGEPVPAMPSRGARSLLAYLITNRDRRHTREALAARFWPDVEAQRARRRLSHALWQIQDAMPLEGELDVGADLVSFSGGDGWWFDVEEFERRVGLLDDPDAIEERDLNRLREGVDLYRGEFLEGFFDDWVVLEAERLRLANLEATAELIELQKSYGRYEDALTYARRLTLHDPLREEAHREVMRLCVLLGRTAEALEQYERCERVLRAELGREPSALTSQIRERIARQRQARPEPLEPAPDLRTVPLVGRQRERTRIIDELERVLAGHPRMLLVEGEGGVGKSRLLTEAVEDASWRGFTILRGACEDLATPRPYGPIVDALASGLDPLILDQLALRLGRSVLAEALRLVPGVVPASASRSAAPTSESSERTRDAVARLLSELGRLGPTALVIEDLHWADAESLELLQQLAAMAADEDEVRLLTAVTYRGSDARTRGAVWEALRSVDRNALPTRVQLPPLTVAETADLVRFHLTDTQPSNNLIRRLHTETGGNPFFLLEILRTLREEGQLEELATSDERLAELPLATSVGDLIGDRVAVLPPAARYVLELAAVLGEVTGLQTLTLGAASLPSEGGGRVGDEEARSAVAELVRRGLLTVISDQVAFAHDHARRAVYQRLEIDRRRALHAIAATAIADTHPERTEQLAAHHLEAERPDRAVPHLIASAERATQLNAYGTAAEHWRSALTAMEAAGALDAQRWRALTALEQALDVLGRRDDQAEVLERIEELAADDRARRYEVHRRRAWLAFHTDRWDDLRLEAETGLKLAKDPSERADLLTPLGTMLHWVGDHEEAEQVLREAVAAYADDHPERPRAVLELGQLLRHMGRSDDAAQQLQQAFEEFDAREDLSGQSEALSAIGVLLAETGSLDEAIECMRRSIDLARRVGYRRWETGGLMNLGNALSFNGQIGEGISVYEQAEAIAATIGARRQIAIIKGNRANLRQFFLGDVDTAERDALESLEYWRHVGAESQRCDSLVDLGDIHRRRGQYDKARAYFEEAIPLAADDPWAEVQTRQSYADLEIDVNDPAAALGHLELADMLCKQHQFVDFEVEVKAQRAYVLWLMGRGDLARRLMDEAVASGRPGFYRRHLIQLWRYEILRDLGEHDEAIVALDRAHSLLQGILESLEEADREFALSHVPEYQRILESWQRASRPDTARVRLASASAPTGRPLEEDEWVEVAWTVQAPEDAEVEDGVTRRHHRLLRLLREARDQGGSPTVEDLAGALDVSVATVRRDLQSLRKAGHEVRTRGTRKTG